MKSSSFKLTVDCFDIETDEIHQILGFKLRQSNLLDCDSFFLCSSELRFLENAHRFILFGKMIVDESKAAPDNEYSWKGSSTSYCLFYVDENFESFVLTVVYVLSLPPMKPLLPTLMGQESLSYSPMLAMMASSTLFLVRFQFICI